jgi:hypothetical protein
MQKHTLLIVTVPVVSVLAGLVVLRAQQNSRDQGALTALDYFEIEQLMYRYGHAIDQCTNNGYDYADLYTPDGVFIDNFTDEGFRQGGLTRAVGREALARAAGGGSLGCKDVGWKDWSHLMINPVITATPTGAMGRVFAVAIGENGPRDVTRFGGYEDVYVKTGAGWRIQKRTHVRNKAWSNPLLQTPDLN